jgi:hypothetical protein
MPSFPLTPTRDAATCLTFLGRTGEAVVGAADGISGGRDGKTTFQFFDERSDKVDYRTPSEGGVEL